MDDLIGCKQIKFDSYGGDIEWTEADYNQTLTFVQNLYRESVQNPSEDNFQLKLQELNPNMQTAIKECYDIRKNEIFQCIVKESLLKHEFPVVQNIDWKLKWIMGSSKLSALREPVVQVDLHCFKSQKENVRQTINFEMNLDQVDQFIAELERIQMEIKK